MAKGSIDALISEDYVQMERWVESSLPSADFAYAALVRTNGKVLSHSNKDYVTKKIQTATTGTHGTTQSTYNQRPVEVVIHPIIIGDNVIANAHVAYYLDTESILHDTTLLNITGVLLISLIKQLLI